MGPEETPVPDDRGAPQPRVHPAKDLNHSTEKEYDTAVGTMGQAGETISLGSDSCILHGY